MKHGKARRVVTAVFLNVKIIPSKDVFEYTIFHGELRVRYLIVDVMMTSRIQDAHALVKDPTISVHISSSCTL